MKFTITLRLALAAAFAQAQTVTIVATFNGANGTGPVGLLQGTDGNFYGTTQEGGRTNNGTIFKLTPAGVLTSLYTFGTVSTDGVNPSDGLIQAKDGNFYGVTVFGGHDNWGTVYRITPAGAFTTLYTPGGQFSDGIDLSGELIQVADGNFYGIASVGGLGGDGTVFRMTPLGTLTTLHGFDGTDGLTPQASLLQASDGLFYGTTENGGTGVCILGNGCGTVFKMTPSGTLTTLHSFGATPWGEPLG